MALITIIATDASDLPNLKRAVADILSVLPQGASVPTFVPSAQAQPVSTPATASNAGASNGSDGMAAARHAKQLYADFQSVHGRKPTTSEKQALKAGSPVTDAVRQVTPVVDAHAEALKAQMSALQAQLDAAQGTPAVAGVVSGATAVTDGLTKMPDTKSGLDVPQLSALRMWASDTLQHLPRRNAVLAYCNGEIRWSDVEASGVKAKSALRVANSA